MTPTSLQLQPIEPGAQLALPGIDFVDLLFMLASVMPDSDAGKVAVLLLLILALFGHFKLEFGRFKLEFCGRMQDRR